MKAKHPNTPRPGPAPCSRCGKVLAYKWRKVPGHTYAWRLRSHVDMNGLPCLDEIPGTKNGKIPQPNTPKPTASHCPRCDTLTAYKWMSAPGQPYAWRRRPHSDANGLPCLEDFEPSKKAEKPKTPQKVKDPRRPPITELTITVHAIQMVQKRVRIRKPHECVEWIEKVYQLAKWSFYQDEPKARSKYTLWKRRRWGIRAPHKSTRVDVFAATHGDRVWRFYVRGKVLLTVDYVGMDSEDRLFPVPAEE